MTGEELILSVGQLVLPPGHRGSEGFSLNNDQLRKRYKEVFDYMINPELSRANRIVPEKGILYGGNVGTGKTICMKVIQQMALRVKGLADRQMCIVTVGDFFKLFKEDEAEAFKYYGYDRKMEMCIDELGWEASQRHHYGNDTAAIIGSWIMERHKLFIQTGIRTHYTTNLQLKKEEPDKIDIYKLYGPRIYDRLNESCNVINWMGGSLRK